MGNLYSVPKDKWVKDSLASIQHKFGDQFIKDEKGEIITWEVIESYLGILYDIKYLNLKQSSLEQSNLRYNPEDLDVFI